MEYEFIEHLGGMDVRLMAVSIFNRQTHFHSDVELILCLDGSVLVDNIRERTLLTRGDFFLFSSNEAHSLLRTDQPNSILVLQCNPKFSKAYYPRFSLMQFTEQHVRKSTHPALYDSLMRELRTLAEESFYRTEGYPFALIRALNGMCCDLVRNLRHSECDDASLSRESRRRVRLENIVDFIQKNFPYHITLAEVAAREGLDMSYLSHYIKDNLGISFREYVNRLRLEKAIDLIANTDMRMIDICVECGYSDYRYLNKALFAEFHCTPQQLRQQGHDIKPSFLKAVESDDVAEGQHRILGIDEIFGQLMHFFDEEGVPSSRA